MRFNELGSAGRLRRVGALLGVCVLAATAALVGAGRASAATTDVFCPPTGTDDLQAAIDAAASGSVIRIHGVCVGNFDVPGAGAATSLTLRGVTPGAGLDGDHTGTTLLVRNGVSLTIQTLRIFNGLNDSDRGGGIHMVDVGTSVSLTNSVVTGNATTVNGDDGGGISLDDDDQTLTVTGSTVSRNTTGNNDGGGIDIEDADTVTITNSTITGNQSGADPSAGDTDGGGIELVDSDAVLTVSNSTISGNMAGGSGEGGGIDCENCDSISLSNTQVTKNTAHDSAAGGIGMEETSGTLTIDHSTIAGNRATDDGGGLWLEFSGPVSVTSSWISGNRAAGNGGGVYNEATDLSFGGTTIGQRPGYLNDGNQATFGGGIYNTVGGSVSLQSSSRVVANVASSNGGGILNDSGTILIAPGTVLLLNKPNNCVGC